MIEFSQELLKGQYEYPFQAKLPDTLPTTIEKNNFRNIGYIEITYDIQVKLVGERTLTTILKEQRLRDSKQILITKKPHPIHYGPNGQQEPLLLPPRTKNVKSFGCLKRGYFTLAGYLLNPVVDTNDSIRLRLVSHYWCPESGMFDASHLIVADVKVVQEIARIMMQQINLGLTSALYIKVAFHVVNVRFCNTLLKIMPTIVILKEQTIVLEMNIFKLIYQTKMDTMLVILMHLVLYKLMI